MRLLPVDYAVRNLHRSPTRLLLTVLGSTVVVLLILAASGFVGGMQSSLGASGQSDNVILIGAGSEESTERSEVDAGVAGLLAASIPGIRSRAGVDYVSPQVHAQLPLTIDPKQPKPPLTFIRGVTPTALLVHGAVQLIEGRFPLPGRSEIMVGQMLATRIGAAQADLALGEVVYIEGRPWNIVGRFTAPGTVMDAEAWTALPDLKQTTRRDSDSCIVLTLDPKVAEFADVDLFTKMRVDLELAAVSETQYFARLSQFFAPIRALVWMTAGLIVLGGFFGGLNTMYAAIASRTRELATLQVCGFRRLAIVGSLIQESVFITLTGALLACALAALLFDGVAVRFSMGVFGLRMDTSVIAMGLASGLILGIMGALPPAWRCLRPEIAIGLKSV